MVDHTANEPETMGLPFRYERHPEYCSTTVDDVAELLKDLRRTKGALRLIGTQLSSPLGVVTGYHKFELCARTHVTRSAGHGGRLDPDGIDTSKHSPAAAVVSVLATVGRMDYPRNSVAPDSAKEGENETGTTNEVNRLNSELLCHRLRKGPTHVMIGAEVVPWRTCPPSEPQAPPQAKQELVTLEHVAQETHLITQNQRYRGEDATAISGVHVGDTVFVQDCESKRVLFAGPNALRLQGELELPMSAEDS